MLAATYGPPPLPPATHSLLPPLQPVPPLLLPPLPWWVGPAGPGKLLLQHTRDPSAPDSRSHHGSVHSTATEDTGQLVTGNTRCNQHLEPEGARQCRVLTKLPPLHTRTQAVAYGPRQLLCIKAPAKVVAAKCCCTHLFVQCCYASTLCEVFKAGHVATCSITTTYARVFSKLLSNMSNMVLEVLPIFLLSWTVSANLCREPCCQEATATSRL